LATRTNNPFGQSPADLAQVLRDLDETEPRLRARADEEIDTSVPIDEVVRAVLDAVDIRRS